MSSLVHFVQQYEHPAGWVLEPHTHYTDELTLVAEGRGELLMDSGERIPVRAGSVLPIPARVRHGCVSPDGIVFDVINFDAAHLSSFARLVYNRMYGPGGGLTAPVLGNDQLADYRYIFRKLKQEMLSAGKHREEAVRILMESLMLLLDRASVVQEPASTAVHEAIVAVGRMIETRFREPLKVERLAAGRFLSPGYFREKFKAVYGVPPKQYLNNVRLNEAKRLLAGTAMSVTSVAREAGFTSVHQFNKVFAGHTGETPSEWRRGVRG